jgi:flagellar motor protein MotB
MSEQEQHGEGEQKKHSGGHGGGPGGGGHEEAHEGAPEWIVSFADNVALLMGFFVILLAFSMNKPAASGGGGEGEGVGAVMANAMETTPEYLDAVLDIREAFHNPVSVNSTNPKEAILVRRIMERRGQIPLNENGPPGQKYKMQSIRPSKYYNLCGSVPFKDNSFVLSEEGRTAVMGILEHLSGLRLIVTIRGHISAAEAVNEPDRGLRLSFDRALAVATLLNEHDIEWRRMRLMACGDNDRMEPVLYGKTDQGLNQRVEVILTEELMPDYTPTTESSAPAPAPAAAD